MATCSCKNINHTSWDYSSPSSRKVDDTTIDDLSAPNNTVIIAHNEIISSKDKSKACSLKSLLDDLANASFVEVDSTNVARVKELRKQLCDDVIKFECSCEEKLDDTNASCKDDNVIQAKKDCTSPNVWSNCSCQKAGGGGTPIVINYVDGCIDPKAFNYYCKGRNADKSFKCGDNNDTLPENIIPTQCDYRVNETLKYTYILSNLDNPDPTDSINTWTGPIVITGSSSFDSPDDNSWLTRHYKPWKSYWTEKCSAISDTVVNFSTEKGLYADQGDTDIQADLVNALLKFTSDEGGVQFLKNYKVMIMDENNDNLGVVSLHNNALTLEVRNTKGKSLLGLIAYRTNKNVGGKVSSSRDDGTLTVDDFRKYFKLANKKNPQFYPLLVTIGDDLTVNIDEPVSESIVGLGTLLGKKDKPIIGLGGLL